MDGIINKILEGIRQFTPLSKEKTKRESIASMEIARINLKIEYLEKKIRLIEAAAKCNSVNLYTRTFEGENFISVGTKLATLKKELNENGDLKQVRKKLKKINNYLENVIEKIDQEDCEARDSRKVIDDQKVVELNYGREYIEKLLFREFGYDIGF
jgi:valyl-tRNA synthetase